MAEFVESPIKFTGIFGSRSGSLAVNEFKALKRNRKPGEIAPPR